MAESTQYGSFVPTNFLWEIQQLQEANVNTPEFKEILVRLYQNIGLMAEVLNTKDTGSFQVSEFVTGQLYFSNPNSSSATDASPIQRPVMRKVIYYTDALPAAAGSTPAISHDITCTAATTFTHIYGVANDTVGFNYLPLPYASPTAADNIELRVDATSVYITVGKNQSNFTKTYVVLEYLQS